MPFAFFTIPIRDDGRAADELNAFLRSHRVLAIERRWVEHGTNSYWSFCVDYWERAAGSGGEVRCDSRNRVDYRERLSPDDFALFARLRDRRKQVAQTAGVPVYTVFSNEQLVQLVQTKARTK